MTIYRQGDVLVMRVDGTMPAGAKSVKREAGRIVLAHGELTGHAHAIASKRASLWSKGEERFLKVRERAFIQHEEHAPITLPPGLYKVIRQREYVAPEIDRRVAD